MRKLAILVFILLVIPTMAASAAETPTTINYFDIYFLPELDQPGVLVIMQIDFQSEGEDGISATMKLPEGISELVVARMDIDGTPVVSGIEFQQEVRDGFVVVSFEAITNGIWIEYYDSGLTIDGNQHSFTYKWLQDYAVEKYDIRVQQPYNSLGFVTSPGLGSTWTDQYGLNSFGDGFDNLPIGGSFEFTFSYQKDDVIPSLEAMASLGSSVPEVSAKTDNEGGLPDWALVLIGIGLAGAVGAAVYFFFLQNNASGKSGRNRKRSTSNRFCHSCGKKAKQDDVFCRHCGGKLKR